MTPQDKPLFTGEYFMKAATKVSIGPIIQWEWIARTAEEKFSAWAKEHYEPLVRACEYQDSCDKCEFLSRKALAENPDSHLVWCDQCSRAVGNYYTNQAREFFEKTEGKALKDRIAELEAALREIRDMKLTPGGALFAQETERREPDAQLAQNIAMDAVACADALLIELAKEKQG